MRSDVDAEISPKSRLVSNTKRGHPSTLQNNPFAARAAAANVNPRTRLSHVTPFSGRDWCTRERCRPMMQKSHIFPEFPADDSQNFAAGSRIPQDFPRKSEAPPPTPLRPGACCTEASCVTHWILVRDPLKPSARSTEASCFQTSAREPEWLHRRLGNE